MSGGTDAGHGDGFARVLLGALGAVLVVGGFVMAWKAVGEWRVGALAAVPGIAVAGLGVTLVVLCAFYDEVDVTSGRFGLRVRVRRARRQPGDHGSRQGSRRRTSRDGDDAGPGRGQGPPP